jgi:hypothetical protein
MKISTFFVVKAVICFIFGLGSLLIPTIMWPIYGVSLDPNGLLMTRFLAALLIGIGLILWIYRNEEPGKLKGITLSLFIADTIGSIVALTGQLSGLMNTLGWIVVAIWLFLALGLGYFRFIKTS